MKNWLCRIAAVVVAPVALLVAYAGLTTAMYGGMAVNGIHPAVAATVTVTASPNITIKWNTVSTGTIAVIPNYATTGSTFVTSGTAGTIIAGTGSTCTASAGASTGNVLDFQSVTPPTVGNATACLYQQGVGVQVVTNDNTGWSVQQSLSAAPPAGYALCAVLNNAATSPQTALPITSSKTTTATAVASTVTTAGCASVTNELTLGTTATTVVSTQTAAIGTFYTGEDIVLGMTLPTAISGAGSSTLNFTLILN